ncbi:ATP-binding protein [Gottfriedia sp. NPDC056225]|uniref:ATP-binding protein n=1 Tax=Gottfriedia sp. NPDC056225 TaxID=3345751 RepID=UPI0035D990E1
MQSVDISSVMDICFRNSGAKYIDKYCEQHKKQWIQFPDGRANCPRCFCKTDGQSFQQKINQKLQKEQEANISLHLERYSIISNQKILSSSLDNYKVICEETSLAKQKAEQCAKWYKFGNNFNVVITGNTGVGKSHLAYAIAKEVSVKRRSLFISVPKMVSLILDSFNNKESKYTQEYFLKLMEEVDILVIDDLGAEVGRIDTEKVASDFISKLLFNVYESRQGKSTITTSNLRGERAKKIYDERMISRLNADVTKETIITFKTAKDMR